MKEDLDKAARRPIPEDGNFNIYCSRTVYTLIIKFFSKFLYTFLIKIVPYGAKTSLGLFRIYLHTFLLFTLVI
jgi:hypothetical protein